MGPDIPIGPYPTVIENTEKKRVLVVQASSYTKYLGNITVFYNRRGEVVDWSGAPVFLGTAVPQGKSFEKCNCESREIVNCQK